MDVRSWTPTKGPRPGLFALFDMLAMALAAIGIYAEATVVAVGAAAVGMGLATLGRAKRTADQARESRNGLAALCRGSCVALGRLLSLQAPYETRRGCA
jgi:hypothetical protein